MRSKIAALALFFAGCFLPIGHASAQSLERLCTPVYNAVSGAMSCVDTGWQPSQASALAATVTAVRSSNSAQLGALNCYNPNASVAYVQVFDVATAAGVTLGTTTPTLVVGIPASVSGGFNLGPVGFHFANGVQIAATTTATGSTGVSTGLVCNAAYN